MYWYHGSDPALLLRHAVNPSLGAYLRHPCLRQSQKQSRILLQTKRLKNLLINPCTSFVQNPQSLYNVAPFVFRLSKVFVSSMAAR